ncbi:MAG TPA: CHRD domain-containing protein [Reyranellaceae bacterium]|nr:CHRD domain-containing protein [Reyranellaceae bacterium]
MTSRYVRIAAPIFAALLLAAAPAVAEMQKFKAELKGASEVPPVDSKGSGTLEATYDTATKKLTYTVTYSGLSGPPTMAHFHGPAAPTANAGIVLPATGPLASPIKGEATLTDAQAADLQAGRWYFNIHTDAHKPGEIRGQVVK